MGQFVDKIKWSCSLEEEDRIKYELLEDFFAGKTSMPGTDSHGENLIRCNMTSEEIMDTLSEMADISKEFIYTYMKLSEFKTVLDHGKVKWQIFRVRNSN